MISPERPIMSTPSLAAVSQDLLAGDHHAQVDHLVVVAAEHDADDVLADVVDVAFDGRQQHLAAGLAVDRRCCAFPPP